jgi:MFS superfamily sulfate permease-like transporter
VGSDVLEQRNRRQGLVGDVAGSAADLGVMVPLATALILVNHLDASAVFLCAGLLVLASGAYFGIPFPVQPLKALTAVAVAQQLAPGVIHAAGIEIAGVLLLLSIGGVADVVARVFTKPIVRALQLGVGVLLVITATRLVLKPPDVFRGTPPSPWPFVLALATFVVAWWAARTRRYAFALIVLGTGVAAAWTVAAPKLSAPTLSLPQVAFPHARDFATALLLLVVPQLPLTFGNAVVAVSDVAHGAFGETARRVTPSRVCISCGAGNVVSGLLGGMPMCHGAGGLTAHVRLGATSRRMNLILGAAFVVLGLFFANQIPAILGLLPVWGLAAFLAYAGVRHASLALDLRGGDLGLALVAGGLGAYAGNLAVTVAIGLAVEGLRSINRRRTHRPRQTAATS